MITPLDARAMDANAVAVGVSVEELMRNAGKAVADLVLERHPESRVRIFCGHGNNGGDGLAVALNLPGAKITAVDGTDMKTDAAKAVASDYRFGG